MSESLEKRNSVFDGLKWSYVEALAEVLRECELRNERHIEKIYKTRASNFFPTLAFLACIGLIKQKKDNILRQEQCAQVSSAELCSLVLESILRSGSKYCKEITGYLGGFSLHDGEVSYRPNANIRSKESAVRNFLMEVGVVGYNTNKDQYFILPERLAFYVHALENKKCLPIRLFSSIADHEEIGLAAEKVVVAYEKKRLGSDFANQVNHVAIRNVAAGYDVLSVTTIGDKNTKPRYIEVKAVSARSFQFHWTHNEVQVARLLGDLYYVYLLPVGLGGKFLTDHLVMQCNPYDALIVRKKGWLIENDVLLCRPEKVDSLYKRLAKD